MTSEKKRKFTYLIIFPLLRFGPIPVMASTYEASLLHSLDTKHSVELLWMSDQSEAENSTWQHTIITRDKHPILGRIRTHTHSKQAATNPRHRPRGRWDQLTYLIRLSPISKYFFLPNNTETGKSNTAHRNESLLVLLLRHPNTIGPASGYICLIGHCDRQFVNLGCLC